MLDPSRGRRVCNLGFVFGWFCFWLVLFLVVAQHFGTAFKPALLHFYINKYLTYNYTMNTEDINLPIEKIEKIKNDMKCYKCKKIIYKTFGSYRICQDCRYELSKLNKLNGR